MSFGIIPRPKDIEGLSETQILVTSIMHPSYNIQGLDPADSILIYALDELTILFPGISESESEDGATCIITGGMDSNLPDDWYQLELQEKVWKIDCNQTLGLLYAIQTIKQIVHSKTFYPAIITDYSSFEWRGFMLDCSRHFVPVDGVKRILDSMVLHKMNRFHWHLTDDQGWRVQIDAYPLLTEVGAKRSDTQIGGRFSKDREGCTHEGFYSKDNIREIVVYALERGIEVIPEIEILGHATAAAAAYPFLTCHKGELSVPETFGIFTDVMCAGSQQTMRFVKEVLREIAELFPSPWIHIGGDEVPRKQWKSCEVCRDYLEKEGSDDIEDLQQIFLHHVYQYITGLGKTPIGWNEILDGNRVDTTPIVQYWTPYPWKRKKIRKTLLEGRKIIVSDYFHSYLDQSHAVIPLKSAYRLLPDFVRKMEYELILGFEAPLWSEWVANEEHLDWQVFPRLTAMADRMWAGLERDDYEDFLKRLERFIPIMQNMGIRPSDPSAWSPSLIRRFIGLFHLSDDTHDELIRYSKNNDYTGA
mgnify:CR=1 FL=1